MISRSLIITLFSAFSCLCAWGGRNVVPTDIYNSSEFRLAADFLNHYSNLLSSPQTEAVGDSLRRAKDGGFRYIVGNDKAMQSVSASDEFGISLIDMAYKASWKKNGRDYVVCTFPANIGLLTFSSKIELENNLARKLHGIITDEDTIAKPEYEIESLTKIPYSDFYVVDKGYYVTPRLKHQVVVAEKDGKGILMYDSDTYIIETLSNIILTGFSPHVISTHIDLSQYGYKISRFDIRYGNLFRLMSEEGCTPYWGIDEFDGNIAKGLCVWVNRCGGYAHVLSISIPVNSISQPSDADIKLNAYIRLDNLKSLFEDYKQ